MKGKAITVLVLAGLCVATCAMALDLDRRAGALAPRSGGFRLNVDYSCDNDSPTSAFFQADVGRYGNVFNFPAATTQLSRIEFVHFGYGFAGPYSYDLELYDMDTCTFMSARNGLSAANAATSLVLEVEDLCTGAALNVSGPVAVTVDANTCLDPTDCYPDVVFDDQLNVQCPVIVDMTVPATPVCIDPSDQSGPFLLRVATGCPTDVLPSSWGRVKVLYR